MPTLHAHGRRKNARRATRCSALACVAIAAWASLTSAAPDHIAIDDPSWRLDSSSDGIALYSGSVPEARVVPVKAIMTIPGRIEDVALVLEDLQRRGDWISNFAQSVLLAKPNDYEQTEYL